MNGTQLMESYDIIKDFEKLEYTDTAKFCQAAYRNRHIALANIVVDEEGEEESPNIRELAEILESKIKENLYDNEAIQIARKLINEEENFYYEILDSKQKKYEKTVRKLISKYRRTAGALKLIQQCLQLIVIIGAASIPLILSNPDSPRETSTYISIAVAISAALLNIYKFRDRTIFQHKAAEKMQYEYSQFLTDRGIYKNLNQGEALDRFMDEIDKLRQETNELALSLEKTVHDQVQDHIQKVGKSIPELHHIKDTH